MLPLVPLVLLAYAALYAFAAPLPAQLADFTIRNPKSFVELPAQDIAAAAAIAIAAAAAAPADPRPNQEVISLPKEEDVDVHPAPAAVAADKRVTELAGPTSMAGRSQVLATLYPGEVDVGGFTSYEHAE